MKWFPVRKLTFFALGVFAIGCIISGCANSFPILLLGRMVQGFGPGLILPMMFALVLEVFPPQKIGAAMGLCAMIVMFAPAVGPTLAGLIIGAFSWRWIFFLFAAILVVGLLFAAKFMISPYELTKPKIDFLSCLTSVIGFGGLVIGVGLASTYGWLSVPVLTALVVGVFCIAVYVARQLRMEKPILNMRAFQIPGFRMGTILVMLTFGITMSSMYLMPQYVQNGLLIPVALTGIALLPGGVMNAVFSLISGRLYDKVGAKGPAMCGFLLATIGTVMLLMANTESPIWYVILCHMVLLSGVPLAMSPSQTSGLNSLPPELSTDGSAILNTMQQVWGAVCTAVATSLLGIGRAAYVGAEDATGAMAFTNGVHYGLYFTLILAVLGFLLSLKLPKRVSKPEQAHQEAVRNPLCAIMKSDVYTIQEDATLLDALQLITEKKISGVPVLSASGQPVGFVSDGDILRYLSNAEPLFVNAYSFAALRSANQEFDEKLRELVQLKVADIIQNKLIYVDVNDDLGDVCRILNEQHLKKVPVMENGRMVGIINRSNITKYALNLYHQQLK